MHSVTEHDLRPLQSDIAILEYYNLGILVGIGSIALQFSDGSSLLIQCPFELLAGTDACQGHGENPATAPILFRFLNERVISAAAGGTGESTLRFGIGTVRIVPDHSGLEFMFFGRSRGVVPVF